MKRPDREELARIPIPRRGGGVASDDAASWEDVAFDRFPQIREVRAPFALGNARIVRAMAERFIPDLSAGAQVLEIAAGDGQLREWLPARALPGLVQTDASETALRYLRLRYPEAQVLWANIYKLPFDDASQDLLLGLNAFDVFQRAAAARDEILRVAKPGARLLFFGDMGVNTDNLFRELHQQGYVPLPNFVGAREIRETLAPGEALPVEAPTDRYDFLLTEQAELKRMLLATKERARRSGDKADESAAGLLELYCKMFDRNTFHERNAATWYMDLSRNQIAFRAYRLAIARHFLDDRNKRNLAKLVRPLSSADHFKKKLDRLFGESCDILASSLVAARVRGPRPKMVDPAAGFGNYRYGWIFTLAAPPDAPFGTPLAEAAGPAAVALAEAAFPEATDVPDAITLESDVLVFVAQKRGT